MAKMRAVDAAVLVLEKEGIDCAFGVPGAAINPFYSALKARGSLTMWLAPGMRWIGMPSGKRGRSHPVLPEHQVPVRPALAASAGHGAKPAAVGQSWTGRCWIAARSADARRPCRSN